MSNLSTLAPASNQGVVGWSQPFIWQDFVIFCCGSDPYQEAAFTTYATGNGAWFKSLIGSYAGKSERSFLMTREAFEAHNIAAMFCKKEESILILGCPKSSNMHLPAELRFLSDDSVVPIGKFAEVSKKVALGSIGWTYDPSTKKWFTCLPDKVTKH